MASLGFRMRSLEVGRKLKLSTKSLKRVMSTRKSPTEATSYYVLLPEMPPDTKETNSVLRTEDLPSFNEITPENCVAACAKRSIEFDVEVGNFLDTLKKSRHTLKFEDIFDPIEKYLVPMNFSWRTTKHLNYVKSSQYKDAFQRVHPQIENAKNIRWVNKDLYLALKELKANHSDGMSEQQNRLVDMYLLEGRLNGIELTGATRTKFINHLIRLSELKTHFRNRVMMCNHLFHHTVDDWSLVSDFPKDFLSKISLNKLDPSRGPWKLTLNNYDFLMSRCSDRMTRWNLWYAQVNKAGKYHDEKNLSNHVIIEEIRNLRQDVAKFLDYPTYADMSMETKMAGSVDNVIEMIDNLKQKFQPVAEAEVVRLQEFAGSLGFKDKLKPWDIHYWRNQQLNHLHPLKVEELKEYFPLPRVMEYLFGFFRVLLGLQFIECTEEVQVWHEDVKFYKIIDLETNEHISSLFLDPYMREGKMNATWIENGRERSKLLGLKPFSYFCLNLDPPESPSIPSLLNFDQLQKLFYEFGHGLQQLATKSPFSETSGQRNIEWDSLNSCAYLMKMILNTRQTLSFMSRHFRTKEPLPEETVNTLMRRRHHMEAFDTMQNLCLSAYDIEIHTSKEQWYPLMEKTWNEFMPLPFHDDDNTPCSMTSIFCDKYPAAHYSFKWSEMLACDIFKTFKKASQTSTEEMSRVGRRFRETILALGGSVPAAEVFKRFQNSPPSTDSLVAYHLKE